MRKPSFIHLFVQAFALSCLYFDFKVASASNFGLSVFIVLFSCNFSLCFYTFFLHQTESSIFLSFLFHFTKIFMHTYDQR